jgi:hypothetical protein
MRRIALATATTSWLMLLAFTAAAQPSRLVIVNGQRQDPAALARLDRAACTRIPDGAYWLNTRNGAWGYAGNPTVQGVLGDACSATGGTGGQVAGDGTYGPYATMRRANEVANDLRRRGLRAVAFHNGDGYYVRASP